MDRGVWQLQSVGLQKVGHNLATKQQQPSLWSSSHLYMTAGKTMALTIQTFVDKVMSLLFKMLSRLDIAIPPRSKRLLISWPHSPYTVTLEPKKMKSNLFPHFPHLFSIK